jgi:hypothetical protein
LRAGGATERIESAIDLYGQRVLRSPDAGATLFYGRTDESFTAFDCLGPRRSVLHAIRAALGRVPFDGAASLTWSDSLPARADGSWLTRPLRDLVAPFVGLAGLEMDYEAARDGEELVVTGRSRKRRAGEPLVRTRARLARGRGIVALELHQRGRVVRAERVEEPTSVDGAPAMDERPRFDWPRDAAPHVLEPLRSQPGES